MKKFKFTLQRLANAKQTAEKAMRLELKKHTEHLNLLGERTKTLENSIEEQTEALKAVCAAGILVYELKTIQNTLENTKETLKAAKAAYQAQSNLVEEHRIRLARVLNEQKVLEEIEQRQRAEYKQEEAKESSLAVEEFCAARKTI